MTILESGGRQESDRISAPGRRRPWRLRRTGSLAALLACLALGAVAATADNPPAPAPEPGGEIAALEARLGSARSLLQAARLAEAEAEGRAVLEAARALGGSGAVTLARAMDLVAECLWRGGRVRDPETMRLAEEAIRIKEAALGPDHPEVAVSLRTQATILINSNPDPPRARALLDRALAIQRNALGPDDPEIATTLNSLGVLLMHVIGDHAGAIRALSRSVAIREKALGPDHPDLAKSLSNLGFALFRAGETTGIKPLFERAVAIAERAHGPDHPLVMLALNSLGIILTEEGDYPAARATFERALAIGEKSLGPDHPDVATAYNHLGSFYHHAGEYARAIAPYRRALEIREKALGPDHRVVAADLNNLANSLYETGDYAAARPLLERALPIFERTPGPPEDLGTALDGLADVSFEMGDLAGARVLYQRAVEIIEKALGPDHVRLAEQLDSLGVLQLYTGAYAEAAATFERARAIHEKLFGPIHPEVAADLANLARIDYLTGAADRGIERALRAERSARDHYRGIARGLTEGEALRFGARRATGLDVALSVLASPAGEGPASATVARVWDELLRSRALVLDEVAARQRAARLEAAPGIRALHENVGAARRRLARIAVRGPDPGKPAEYRERLQQAMDDKEKAESALAAQSAAYREERARDRIGFAEVAAALPADSALVAYAVFGRLGRRTGDASAPADAPVPWERTYLALVVGAADGAPRAVPLGPAAPIEALVRDWRLEVAGDPRGLPGLGRSEDRYREVGGRLRQAIWDPLAAALATAKTVYIVPDGILHLVNPAALPAGADRYLIETGPLLRVLSGERDLIQGGGPPASGRGLLALGDPEYGPGGVAGPIASAAIRGTSGTGAGAECRDYRGLDFRPLPEARREAKEITALWKKHSGKSGEITLLTGAAATEAAFKKMAPGRRVVHLATHGFFVGGACGAAAPPSKRRIEPGRALGGAGLASPGESPLLSAGLALSGANRAAGAVRAAGEADAAGATGAADGDAEDGILTAEEIGALDLSGVDLVVLSGCGTGLGPWQTGEGILGLQRALRIAGAGTLVMSLWPAADAATRDWMRRFYAHRLGGAAASEAVRHAGREVLAARRAAGRATHPFYWGAFVAVDD